MEIHHQVHTLYQPTTSVVSPLAPFSHPHRNLSSCVACIQIVVIMVVVIIITVTQRALPPPLISLPPLPHIITYPPNYLDSWILSTLLTSSGMREMHSSWQNWPHSPEVPSRTASIMSLP